MSNESNAMRPGGDAGTPDPATAAARAGQQAKAIEFAHYLAGKAERFLDVVNDRDALRQKVEEGDEVSEQDLERADEVLADHARGLRSGVYEFRKRADRIGSAENPNEAPEGRVPEVPSGEVAATPVAATAPVPVASPAPGELVTFWLYEGNELVGSKRMPVGTSHDAVRFAASADAIFCDRGFGETPLMRETRIRNAGVRVYNDRPDQERARRSLPFELRGLFPKELPFFELTFRSDLRGFSGARHLADLVEGLQQIACRDTLGLTSAPGESGEPYERTVRVRFLDRVALGQCEVAMKAYLGAAGVPLVSEFGVGYVRCEPQVPEESEPQAEHPSC
ncbi:hypothetical protein [Variovorax gossypii]|uniref:hypothetical protein n=1 Tax=uncultured Variovorax sp. TaxID=114708 RepID=UPI002610DBEB|nr:hypothetical protein [uncultured Variovorax sp.]